MVETRKLAAIFAADVVGFSRLTGADEDRTLARLRTLRSDLIDPTIAVHKGRVVKRTGDGAIIEFRSVVDAVRCAIEVQNAMAERNSGVPEDQRIEFRIGVHLGDVVEEDDGDLMGDGVNIATRLEGVAKPGAICLSEDAYRQVKSRLDMNVSDLGPTALKNIAEPLRVYSVEVGKAADAPKPKPTPRGWFAPVAAAIVALIVMAAAAAWYLTAGKPAAVVASSAPAPPPTARSGVPTVAILPFANVTGNPQYDPLTQRIGQKTRDAAGNATIWRIVGRPGGAAGTADPIEAGRQLNADYVVTGNLEAGGEAPRVTFHVDDVHSGARIWSQPISPVLESVNSAAAEAEVAGRAEGLLSAAILDAERTRLSAAGDLDKTTWGCVLEGFALKPETVASARACLEAAAQREPANANVWKALTHTIDIERVWGWGLPPEEASVEKRAHLADRELYAALRAQDLAPLDSRAQYYVAMGYFATCQADRVRVEAEKAAALNPYDANALGDLGLFIAFTGHWDDGTALAEKALKLAGPSAAPFWWWPKAKRAWFRGDYPEAYETFQRAYIESFWLSHLDLAYTLPFLGRVDEAKQHVAALLKMYPTMTIREADAFYKLVCFDAPYREKMAGALRQAGLPE
jgi:adenylate cyclase